MGTSASTRCHVKNITIDQNGSEWICQRPKGRNSIPVIGHIFSKSPARPPAAQVRSDKVSLIKRAIKAEANAQDCEVKMKMLERQLRTIELRNHDLSNELAWVKQQKTNGNSKCTEMPSKSLETLKTSSVSPTFTIKNMQTEIAQLKETSQSLMASEVMKDLKISNLTRENEQYRQRVTHLEELFRDKIDDHSLASVSPTPQDDASLIVDGDDTFLETSISEPQQREILIEEMPDKIRKLDRRRTSSVSIQSAFAIKRQSVSETRHSSDSGTVLSSKVYDDIMDYNDMKTGDEDDDFDLTDILNTSVRSTSKSLRSQSGKSRDSGYSLTETASCRENPSISV